MKIAVEYNTVLSMPVMELPSHRQFVICIILQILFELLCRHFYVALQMFYYSWKIIMQIIWQFNESLVLSKPWIFKIHTCQVILLQWIGRDKDFLPQAAKQIMCEFIVWVIYRKILNKHPSYLLLAYINIQNILCLSLVIGKYTKECFFDIFENSYYSYVF